MERGLLSKDIDVSLIIPTWNVSEKTVNGTMALELGMKSIRNQIMENFSFEIIFVDDASTDNTIEILEEIKKNNSDLDISIFSRKINSGSPAAGRNLGIEKARGDYISFMDNDDQLGELGSLAHLYQKAVEWDSDLIIGKAEPTRKNGMATSLFAHGNQKRVNLFQTNPLANIATWSRLYKRNFISEINGCFPESNSIGEDYYFNAMVYSKTNRISIVTDYRYYLWVDADQGHLSDLWKNNKLHDYIKQFTKCLTLFEEASEKWELQNLAAFIERLFTDEMVKELFVVDIDNRKEYIEKKYSFEQFKKQLINLNSDFMMFLPALIELKVKAVLQYDFINIENAIDAIDHYHNKTLYAAVAEPTEKNNVLDSILKANAIFNKVISDVNFKANEINTEIDFLEALVSEDDFDFILLSRDKKIRLQIRRDEIKNQTIATKLKKIEKPIDTYDFFLVKRDQNGEAGIVLPYHEFYKNLFQFKDRSMKFKIYKNWKNGVSLNISPK